MFDPHVNLAYGIVLTPPSPPLSGLTIALEAGQGAAFPNPATVGAYNITIWQAGAIPTAATAEIARVTGKSGDLLTIQRAQESTAARAVVVGDWVALTITQKSFADVEGVLVGTHPYVLITQLAHGFTLGKPLRFNGTTYVLSQADTATHADVIGLVAVVNDANHFTLQMSGYITLSGLVAGSVYFLDPATPGGLTTVEPTAPGQVSKPLLIAVSTTKAVIANFRGLVIPTPTASQLFPMAWKVLNDSTPLFVAEGLVEKVITSRYAGRTLVSAIATVTDAPQTVVPQIGISKNHLAVASEILSTVLTIDIGELTSETAAVPPVINPAQATVALGDIISIDCDAAGGTHSKGLDIELLWQ